MVSFADYYFPFAGLSPSLSRNMFEVVVVAVVIVVVVVVVVLVVVLAGVVEAGVVGAGVVFIQHAADLASCTASGWSLSWTPCRAHEQRHLQKAWTLLALAMLLAGVVGLAVAVAVAGAGAAAAAVAVAVEVAVAVARLQKPTPSRGPWRVPWPSKDGASFAASFAQLYRIFRARPTMISQKRYLLTLMLRAHQKDLSLKRRGPE